VTARLVPVRDAGDPAIALYTSVRDRDLLRADERVFVAEGEVVVRVLATRSRFRARSLLVEERRVAALDDVVAALDDDVPVYVAPQRVMDEVVGFPIHRGVLALGDRGDAAPPDAVLAGGDLVVGIVGVTNHDNVGGIFRNAAAFGASAVLFDRTTCDPLYRKAIRVSVGGALVVPFARCEGAETMLDALARGGFALHALTPGGDEPIEALREPGRRAILVGAEGPGLPEDVLRRARRVRIGMSGALDSLNVAVAAALALHEARRSTLA
jgi:tRNA G18 (ribose-2'-O)-methylase SpoU